MGTPYFIICPHDRPRSAFLYSGFECRQIYLIQRTVAEVDIDMPAPLFLIVQGKVFHTSSNPIFLQFLHIGNNHDRSQIGIFSQILEITAVERRAINIATGGQQHVFTTITGFLSYALSIKRRHFGIPRSRQTSQCWKRRTGIVRKPGNTPTIPQNFFPHTMRSIAHPQLGNTETRYTVRTELTLCRTQLDFFFECHTRQGFLHANFDRLALIEIQRLRGLRHNCHCRK